MCEQAVFFFAHLYNLHSFVPAWLWSGCPLSFHRGQKIFVRIDQFQSYFFKGLCNTCITFFEEKKHRKLSQAVLYITFCVCLPALMEGSLSNTSTVWGHPVHQGAPFYYTYYCTCHVQVSRWAHCQCQVAFLSFNSKFNMFNGIIQQCSTIQNQLLELRIVVPN